MKLYYLLLLIFFQIQAFGQSIPLEKVFDNNQNDSSNSLSLKKKGTWYNVYNLNFDLPENVQSAKYVHGIIDYDQVVFQSCKSLNDTIWNDVRLTYSINRWGIDTVGCSSKKINSFINGVVLRFNDDENLYYAIDQNNNYDFRDETFYQVSN